jgi:hypothetical protein
LRRIAVKGSRLRRPPRATLTDSFGAAALDGWLTTFMLAA